MTNRPQAAAAEEVLEDAEMAKSPFAHVATTDVLNELKQFEVDVVRDYQKSLPKYKSNDPQKKRRQKRNKMKSMDLSSFYYSWDSVTVQTVLGEGGFSFVFHVLVENKGYALKCLKAKSIHTKDDLTYNAMDLFTEAHILTNMDHPHIIGLHGVADTTLAESYRPHSPLSSSSSTTASPTSSSSSPNKKNGLKRKKTGDGFFVLLDIMQDTLFQKLAKWRLRNEHDKKEKKLSTSKIGIVNRFKQIALPVIDAMIYLHQHNIVLRDLKPENIGFDTMNQVKLFDFGLARELSLVEEGDVAGSICYMAPEIMLEQGTYLASDVYSFAIVLWELCTLQIPLSKFTNMDQVKTQVGKNNWRPSASIATIPSKTIRQLLNLCWAPNPKNRPSFAELRPMIEAICNKEKYRQQAPYPLNGSRNSIRAEQSKLMRRMHSQTPVSLVSNSEASASRSELFRQSSTEV